MAVCNLKKCKSLISAGQQSIPCHSCENIFHAKCLGYSGLVRDAIDMRSGLRYYCDECIAYETQALSIRRLTKSTVTELIRNSRRNTDLLVALESQLTSRMLSEPDSPKRKKIAVDRQPTVAASVTLSGDPGSAAQQSISAAAQMVLRSKAKKDSVSECKGREILPHETPEKSAINNTLIIPTPHVDLTSGVPNETGSAAVNAVVPKPVTCVVPKTVTCVPQRKQIFVSRLNPDLSSLDITAYIRNKVQIDDLKVERFNFPYAREVSSFKIGVPCAHFATMCSANFWPAFLLKSTKLKKENSFKGRWKSF